ncbi:MAG: hypothetical protein ABW212_05535 [Pseudonocardia sediminis]
MSSATVATIACLALVGAAGMAVWVALQQRRTDELARSLTARKWDIVTLRAELGALRRQVQGAAPTDDDPPVRAVDDDGDHRGGDPGGDGLRGDGPRGDGPEGDGHEGGEPAPRPQAGAVRSPAAPSAWRRDRARGASSRPRRRPLF